MIELRPDTRITALLEALESRHARIEHFQLQDELDRRTVTLTAAEGSDLRQQGKPILFRGHAADEDGPLAGESSAEASESRSPEAPIRKGSG